MTVGPRGGEPADGNGSGRRDGDSADATVGDSADRSADERSGSYVPTGLPLRKSLRIARWEITRSVGTVDRKTMVALIVMALVVGTIGISVVDRGAGLEDEIYTVGVSEDSPYATVVEADDRFASEVTTHAAFRSGDVDAHVFAGREGHVEHGGSSVDRAAFDAFRDAIDRHNERLMRDEPDEIAAYPVYVTVEYQRRGDLAGDDASDEDPDSPGDGSGNDGGGTRDDPDGGAQGGGASPGDGDESATDDGSGLAVPELGGGTIDGDGFAGTPGSLTPPFPFESLVLAFLFVVPMNFVIQAYGSTIVDERINRRGEMLLVAPVSRHAIVAGKTLPYLLALLAMVAGIAVLIGGGLLSIAAAVPIALCFLAATFVGAMLARSFKELTFVTVTISVVLTTYTFVPAIFTDVTPIALISPLTLVVMDLQGSPVSAAAYGFSTGPFYCSALVLFLLGVGVYREEDMFTQKPIPEKVLDAIANRIRGYWSVPLLSILFIPFAVAAQLLGVSLLFAVPEGVALPVLIVLAAAIEELAKSVHVYAGFARGRFEATLEVAIFLGVLSGAGFFLGEKLTHAVQFVGLSEYVVGQVAFGPAISADPIVLAVVFLAPLVLHAVTAVIAALGASRGRPHYAAAFLAATLVHATYNLGVLAVVG